MSLLAFVPNTQITEHDATHATFVIEPLLPGFGQTLGNALRRVLLSHLNGAAVTRLRIDGASHEFSTLPGVKEDVVQILLLIKQVRFKMHTDQPQTVRLEAKGAGLVTAADLQCPSGVEVANPDLALITLTDAKAKVALELTVEAGRGYRAVPEENLPIGVIGLDAKFSPVARVSYVVEDTRVGQMTNLDRLTMDIVTDGSVSPAEAFKQSSALLVEAFESLDGTASGQEPAAKASKAKKAANDLDDSASLEDLGISTRVLNSLKKAGIETVGDMRSKDRDELLAVKNLGEKSLDEVLKKIA
jgi:DNA-directed RNA polymerase subunit alpha